MNIIGTDIDTTTESTNLEVEETPIVDGIKELNSIEMAYVGGGTASMAFQ